MIQPQTCYLLSLFFSPLVPRFNSTRRKREWQKPELTLIQRISTWILFEELLGLGFYVCQEGNRETSFREVWNLEMSIWITYIWKRIGLNTMNFTRVRVFEYVLWLKDLLVQCSCCSIYGDSEFVSCLFFLSSWALLI